MQQRETLGSRLGFILISAGCAIGIGNVWKFPYLAGQSGGGIFVLVYLFFLAILGLPVMTMEFSVGRAAQKSPILLYQQLEPKGTKWHIHGWLCLIGCVLLMMYYTTVCGWMIQYFAFSLMGKFEGMSADEVGAFFGQATGSAPLQVGCMALVIVVGFFVNSRGLQNGLERVTKVMMIALIIIMMILAVNSVFLPGAEKGLSFYLLPSVKRMEEVGFAQVCVNAMNQAFFTLSVGIGAMAIFGSYIDRSRSLMGESVNVIVLDTLVALCSGLIIFPACFAYGVRPDSGPSLIFITLPNIFNHMPLGRLWGSLFFVFMTFAAFSTVLAVFENIMAMTMDLTGWDRKKTALVDGILLIVLSTPCALGFNVWSSFSVMGKGVLDLEDFAVSNFLLPLGSLVFVLFCTRKNGWGWDNFMAEANAGTGVKVKKWMRGYVTWILPLVILLVFIVGLL